MTDDLSLDNLLAEVRAKRPELRVELSPKPVTATPAGDPVRRRWLCVMHLLGASFNQLGKSIGRRAQTVNQAIDRELPQAQRATQRLSLSLSFEALSWYTDCFYRNRLELMQLTPQAAAQWLRANHCYQQGE